MPEYPDITIYVEALESRICGQRLDRVRIASPFLLRTVDPPVGEAEGHGVVQLRRVGKRIAIGMDNDVWLVWHLMITGRFHWRAAQYPLKGRNALAALDFPAGALVLTEAGTERRASLHMARGDDGLRALDPGGLDVFSIDVDAFAAALTAENHTLKRVLTDPKVFSGIGNAYSDEILHWAGLSPVALTQKLTAEEIRRLFVATREALDFWTAKLRQDAAGGFPQKVTAFRPDMAVHGRYGLPCPRCGTKVQRIRYAANETNYCPRCQTDGRLLADRALSRLLGADWPKRIEMLE